MYPLEPSYISCLATGIAVVGCEGLKIEPLPKALLEDPIKDWSTLCEPLSQRPGLGFGGAMNRSAATLFRGALRAVLVTA